MHNEQLRRSGLTFVNLLLITTCTLTALGAVSVFPADVQSVTFAGGQTNFGSIDIGSSSMLTLTYNINASITFAASPAVVTQGTPNLDFTLSRTTCTGSQTAGSTCTVTVKFVPRAPGLRLGAVRLTDSSGNLLVTTLVHGVGLGPAVAFVGGAQANVGSGLDGPRGVTVDAAGDIFIANWADNLVVEVPSGGGAQTTLPTSGLDAPYGVAVDGAGNLFISDYYNDRVVELPAGGGSQTTVISGLNWACGVAVDGAGDLFVADYANNRVVEAPAGGGAQTTVGSGLYGPHGVAVDAGGDVFIADMFNNRVVEVPAGGGPQTTVNTGSYTLTEPPGVRVDAAGDVFIADGSNNRVVEVPASDGPPTTVGSGLVVPYDVAADGTGDVFIADCCDNRVVEVQRSQPSTLIFGTVNTGSTSSPQTVTLQNIGNGALTFTGFATSTNFTLDAGTTTCSISSPMGPGLTCNVGVDCEPTTTGSLSGTLTITDNALNVAGGNQSVPLQCSGLGILTTTALTSSPNPSTGGETIAFIAIVTPAPTDATGLGSVKWVANGTTIGVIGLLAADKGVVTLNDWSLIPSATPYSVEATYVPPAGGTLAGSTSNTVMQTINIEPTSTTLSTSPNPSTGGQTVTFTATVTASNGATPAGTVAFKSGSSLLENVSLSSGMAVLNYANLIAGTDSITANYLGSNYMTASTSNVVLQVVSGYATSTALASTPNPSLAGHTVAFTATVTATAGGVPTGKVTFMNGATSIGTATLNGSGVAVLSYASLPAGTDSITATYTGSTTDVPSTSAVVSQVVNLASTTTKLSASPNPSSVGQAVAFTATVTVSGGGTATGTVTFRNGTATIGTATLNGSGVAVLDYAGLPVGTSSITAAYGGSTMDAGSTSAALAQVVNLDATSTVLTSSLNPSSGGQTVTFTATVSAALGSVPTGWVKFYNGTTAIGTLSLSSGVAKLNDSELGAGTHSITATYGGSGTDATSTSPVVSQVVNYDPTTTALTTSPNPSTSGASVTMTATVTPGNGVAAGGEVSFYSGSTLLGNVALSGGVATLSHAFTTGTYSLTAKYDGSQYKSGSTSNVVTQTVN